MTEEALNDLCRRVTLKQFERAKYAEKIDNWLPYLEEAYNIALALAHFGEIHAEGFKTLKEGQSVTFEVADGEKGPVAKNIVAAG